jgi:hypothetical protein
MPVDLELFNRTAPRWNCVAFPGEGMHYVPGNAGCLWCGLSNQEIRQERQQLETIK